MTKKEKFIEIDEFLRVCEDWMHGEDSKRVTRCRKILFQLNDELSKLHHHTVISRRELLLDFAEYSENDNTSTTLDECVDNYLYSIKQ